MSHFIGSNPILDKVAQDDELKKKQEQKQEQKNEASAAKLKLVEDSLATSSANIAADRKRILEGITKQADIMSTVAPAINEIKESNQIAQTAKDTALLEEQNLNIELRDSAGGVENQNTLLSDLADSSNRLQELHDERVDILNDNPTGLSILDAIINGFRTVGVNQDIRATRLERNETANSIAKITGAQEQFAKVNSLAKKTVTQGVIEANYRKIGAEAKLKIAKLELEGIQSNSAAMKDLAMADAQMVSNRVQAFRLDGEVESLELRRMEADLKRKQMEVSIKLLPTQLAQSQASLEATQLSNENIKALAPSVRAAAIERNEKAVLESKRSFTAVTEMANSAKRGFAGMGQFSSESDAVLAQGIIDKNPRYLRAAQLGARYELESANNPSAPFRMGFTFAEAMESAQIMGSPGAAKPTKFTEFASDILEMQAEVYSGANGGIPRDPAILTANLNSTATTARADNLKEVSGLDNPFHAPPMGVLSTFPSVRNSALYKKILKAKDLTDADAQTVMDAAIEAIGDTLTFTEASEGVETLYKAAIAYNNTLEDGVIRFGMRPQNDYIIKLENPSGFFDNLGLDVIIAAGVPVAKEVALLTRFNSGLYSSKKIPTNVADLTAIENYMARVKSIAVPRNKREGE